MTVAWGQQVLRGCVILMIQGMDNIAPLSRGHGQHGRPPPRGALLGCPRPWADKAHRAKRLAALASWATPVAHGGASGKGVVIDVKSGVDQRAHTPA